MWSRGLELTKNKDMKEKERQDLPPVFCCVDSKNATLVIPISMYVANLSTH